VSNPLDIGPALIDRSYRTVLEVTGADRATWLHNLTTNHVKTLQQGQGNYAFALNVKGRILFDMNLMVRKDRIWVDLDRLFLATARAHFDKYIITEDVSMGDGTADGAIRFALVGQRASDVLAGLGLTNAVAMPLLDHTAIEWEKHSVALCRTDPLGCRGFDLWIPAAANEGFVRALQGRGVTHVADEKAEVRRIEAGIPAPGREIHDEVLPGETGQFERAVAINKGCYLRIEGDEVVASGAEVSAADGTVVGSVTSGCSSDALESVIALAYVKTAHTEPGTRVTLSRDGHGCSAIVVPLPFLPIPVD
jgi:glycine cleavage system aminomethyltransferase T